jgi:hypothetical protein
VRRFELVLCRNLAFTCFDSAPQRAALTRLARAVAPASALVLGAHETLTDHQPWLAPWSPGAEDPPPRQAGRTAARTQQVTCNAAAVLRGLRSR